MITQDKLIKRIVIGGFFFGFVFNILSLIILFVKYNYSLSFSVIKQAHIDSPVMYLVDMAPIVLGCTAIFISRLINVSLVEALKEKESHEQRIERLTNHLTKLTKGDFSVETKNEDQLSQAVITLRDTLKANVEAEKLRSWSMKGLTDFSEDLRRDDLNLQYYCRMINSRLVHYVGAAQGGIFVVGDKETTKDQMELQGMYPYDRVK